MAGCGTGVKVDRRRCRARGSAAAFRPLPGYRILTCWRSHSPAPPRGNPGQGPPQGCGWLAGEASGRALVWARGPLGERSPAPARQPICPSSARSAMATGILPGIRNPHRRDAGGTLVAPLRRGEPRRYKKAGGCVAGGQADASPPWVLWRNASAFRPGGWRTWVSATVSSFRLCPFRYGRGRGGRLSCPWAARRRARRCKVRRTLRASCARWFGRSGARPPWRNRSRRRRAG